MTKKELQNTIINALITHELSKAIADKGIEFTDLELCALVYRYSQTYDQRLNLLTLINVNIGDEKLSDYISRIIDNEKKASGDFYKKDDTCVYELQIILDEYACSERYICRDFETALNMIPAWHKRYRCEPGENTEYIIEKRRVLGLSDEFSEDSIASCFLGSNAEVYKYYSDSVHGYSGNSCDGECEGCTEKYCVEHLDIPFPKVFKTALL